MLSSPTQFLAYASTFIWWLILISYHEHNLGHVLQNVTHLDEGDVLIVGAIVFHQNLDLVSAGRKEEKQKFSEKVNIQIDSAELTYFPCRAQRPRPQSAACTDPAEPWGTSSYGNRLGSSVARNHCRPSCLYTAPGQSPH